MLCHFSGPVVTIAHFCVPLASFSVACDLFSMCSSLKKFLWTYRTLSLLVNSSFSDLSLYCRSCIPFSPLLHNPYLLYVTWTFQGWAKPGNGKKQLLQCMCNQCSLHYLRLASQCGPHSKPLHLQQISLSSIAVL